MLLIDFVDIKNWEQKPFNHIEIAEKDAALWEYFVANTEGFINKNIQKNLGLANGTRIKYHSIVPKDDEQMEIIQNHLNSEPLGAILYLDEPPYAVNVEIVDANTIKWKNFQYVQTKLLYQFCKIKLIQNGKKCQSWEEIIINHLGLKFVLFFH